jgi:restriction system protein
MRRRGKESGLEGLIGAVALMPWWAGVIGAVLSYLVLHRIASAPPEVVAYKPDQMAATMMPAIWHGLAAVGQYILPMIFCFGAIVSAVRRRERRLLVRDVAQSTAADALDGMTWGQFEKLVGEGFRLQGYAVEETGGGGSDGGVDLVLRRSGEKFLVQCKQWRAFKVGVDVVRQHYGVMAARGAAGGFVVTSGRFTEDAMNFAEGRNLQLIDGPKLTGLLRQAQRSTGAAALGQAPVDPPSAVSVPSCPLCAKPMIQRIARKGASAGASFWGCTTFPSCKGTRPIA